MSAVGCDAVHELKPRFENITELETWLSHRDGQIKCYVDGTCWHYDIPAVVRNFKGWPVVVIQRNTEEVRESWENFQHVEISDEMVAVSQRKLADMVSRLGMYVKVKYEELDDYSKVAELINYLTAGWCELTRTQFNLFNHMKIEVYKGKVWKTLSD